MNPNKALWEKGDFTRIAASMRESGETLIHRLGIKKCMMVLDPHAFFTKQAFRPMEVPSIVQEIA